MTAEAKLEGVDVTKTPYVEKGHRWSGERLAAEVRLLLPGDHPESIARRLKYRKLEYLIRNLERNGYHQLVAELWFRAGLVRYGHDPRAQEKQW
jgi:hypothetical protein